jgi:uncharacterized RDD family membrane protein YckC
MPTEDLVQPTMGQCAITGKMVPEDELVTIHGQRVCAEGKAILLERLKAGETLPGELERPTIIRRFGCIVLDGIILAVPSFFIGMVFSVGTFATGPGRSQDQAVAMFVIISFVTQTLQLLYFGLLHGSRGQTVGKMAGGIIVVNRDGSPISMGSAFARSFAYTGIGYLNVIAILVQSPAFVLVAGGLVAVYGLANVLFALLDRNQQRSLHDRLADTRVVMKP